MKGIIMANFWVKFEKEIDINAFGTKYIEHKGRYYQLSVVCVVCSGDKQNNCRVREIQQFQCDSIIS